MEGNVGGKKARQLIRLRILDKRKEKKALKLLQEASSNWTALQQKRRQATADDERGEEEIVLVKEKKNRKTKQSSSSVVVDTSDSAGPQSHDPQLQIDNARHDRTRTSQMKRRNQDDSSGDGCSNSKRAKLASGPNNNSTSQVVGKRKEDGGEKKKLRREDLWFDDVAVDIVGGEVVAKQQPLRHNMSGSTTELVTGSDNKARGCIAIDCEMVGGGSDGSINLLARCSIVNHHGNVIYDKYVQPIDTVSDYRTRFSGIRPSHLKDATPFKIVQNEVSELLKDRILVGHSVQNDLKVLFLSHPKHSTRDTARYRPFKRAVKTRTPSLKKLAKELLGLDIQTGEHDSVIDARVAMKLYQLQKFQWEHAHGAQWSDQKRGDHKWLPRGRRAQQKKKGTLHSYSSRQEEGADRVIEPFNVMLHTE